MMQTPEIKRLGSYLVDAGLVSPAQIDVALNDQEFMDSMRIGDILVTRGWIKQQTLDYLVDKIIEPEQQIARQSGLTDSLLVQSGAVSQNNVHAPPSVTPSVTSRQPQQTVAHARSLDGNRIIEITKPHVTQAPQESPTDPGSINERKPLASVPGDDDDMNWVG
ncbi:hypothetical protein IQ266_13055 [filamentous cyanobacterium LEGE 11480]|uniref:Uncharacterized protein n=1 Tax=Romeriopsis navalis LEGE 11480 TaxID=2777977 RepID=A0A928Z2R5_9CYAN|nr:hypothetical protein [Romeriopsis navalis]MBE9030661.1 hypothetical protein [Romeriopsis navalis LEGE 11480]